MKDIMYVACAAIGLLLAGVGLAQIEQSRSPPSRHRDIPAMIDKGFSPEEFFTPAARSSSAGMVPAATVLNVLIGYILQMVGCALYAENRGRSAFFGLLGLLSPIGYVFLALLNPVPRSMPQDNDTTRSG